MSKRIVAILFLYYVLINSAYATCLGVGCSCSVSAIPTAFGSYNPLASTNVDTTGTVTVVCSVALIGLFSVSYTIALNKGNGGNFNPRKMTNGISNLNYNLYTDTLRSIIWGDGTGGTSIVSDNYTLALQTSETRNYIVYGRVPGSQNTATTGNYSDTITVTVVY